MAQRNSTRLIVDHESLPKCEIFFIKTNFTIMLNNKWLYVLIRPTVQRNLRSLNPFFLLSNQSQLSLDLVANDSSIWLKLFLK